MVLLGSAKSAKPVIRPGFPTGTAIRRVLETKSTDVPARWASVTDFMVAGLAAANTSPGAPWVIWLARVALEPKLKRTMAPDLASKSTPIWVNASVSDAAARTVIEDFRVDEAADAPGPVLPQPPASSSNAAAARHDAGWMKITTSGAPRR